MPKKKLLRAKPWLFSIAVKIAVRCLCSGCMSKLKCVQFVFKTPSESSYNRSELLFYAMSHLTIDFGHVSGSTPCVIAAWCAALRFNCTVGSIVKQAFKNLLFALWC